MASKNQTSDPPLEISDVLMAAVARNAARMAELTAATLDATGLFPKMSDASLPGGFLLELGAVLQIGTWERQGIDAHLKAGLPSFKEAAASLATRAAANRDELYDCSAADLSRAVVRFFIDHLAWDGREHFARDVVVGDVDEDQFTELLSEFLWEHRHQLNSLLGDQKGGAGVE